MQKINSALRRTMLAACFILSSSQAARAADVAVTSSPVLKRTVTSVNKVFTVEVEYATATITGLPGYGRHGAERIISTLSIHFYKSPDYMMAPMISKDGQFTGSGITFAGDMHILETLGQEGTTFVFDDPDFAPEHGDKLKITTSVGHVSDTVEINLSRNVDGGV